MEIARINDLFQDSVIVENEAPEEGQLVLYTHRGGQQVVTVVLDEDDIRTLRDTLTLHLEGHKFDTAGSASRQHFIETGRYLTVEESRVAEYHATNTVDFFVDKVGDVWAFDPKTDAWDLLRCDGIDYDWSGTPGYFKGYDSIFEDTEHISRPTNRKKIK